MLCQLQPVRVSAHPEEGPVEFRDSCRRGPAQAMHARTVVASTSLPERSGAPLPSRSGNQRRALSDNSHLGRTLCGPEAPGADSYLRADCRPFSFWPVPTRAGRSASRALTSSRQGRDSGERESQQHVNVLKQLAQKSVAAAAALAVSLTVRPSVFSRPFLGPTGSSRRGPAAGWTAQRGFRATDRTPPLWLAAPLSPPCSAVPCSGFRSLCAAPGASLAPALPDQAASGRMRAVGFPTRAKEPAGYVLRKIVVLQIGRYHTFRHLLRARRARISTSSRMRLRPSSSSRTSSPGKTPSLSILSALLRRAPRESVCDGHIA